MHVSTDPTTFCPCRTARYYTLCYTLCSCRTARYYTLCSCRTARYYTLYTLVSHSSLLLLHFPRVAQLATTHCTHSCRTARALEPHPTQQGHGCSLSAAVPNFEPSCTQMKAEQVSLQVMANKANASWLEARASRVNSLRHTPSLSSSNHHPHTGTPAGSGALAVRVVCSPAFASPASSSHFFLQAALRIATGSRTHNHKHTCGHLITGARCPRGGHGGSRRREFRLQFEFE